MFKIVSNFKIYVSVSLLIVLIGAVAYGIFGGYKTDIDFSGGTMLHIDMEKEYVMADLEAAVTEITGSAPYSLQRAGSGNEVIVKMPSIDFQARQDLFKQLKEKFELTAESPLAMENITPTISNEIVYNAVLAVFLAMILILIYVTVRFEFYSGVTAIVALIHDILIMLAVYALFRVPINSSFIAAILTVVGYSINDTIIVFDRIRENKKFMRKEAFANICEISIWQTMRRSLNTVGTTVVTLIILYFMGVTSIKEFALPLIVGIISGAYSSIFIAAPMWSLMIGDKKQQLKKA